ncbi:MAG: cytochrome c biogenesis protein CcsA [Candidatus Carbobacillus altaicus]|nr:cytochrome c biogenesis protein CcsA [Candidatus Carbobacillus altaicus]
MPGWSLLYELFIVLYALSLIFFFFDFIRPGRMSALLGWWTLVGAFALLTGVLLYEWWQEHTFFYVLALSTRLVYMWLLMLLSIALNTLYRMDLFLFLINLFGFAIVTSHTFPLLEHSLHSEPEAQRRLFVMHVSFALIAEVLFLIAGVLGVMFVIGDALLKSKSWDAQLFRLPSLEKMVNLANRAVLTGVPALAISVILGLVWVSSLGAWIDLKDAKVIWSFVLIGWYSLLIYFRMKHRWPWSRLMWCYMLSLIPLWLSWLSIHPLSTLLG